MVNPVMVSRSVSVNNPHTRLHFTVMELFYRTVRASKKAVDVGDGFGNDALGQTAHGHSQNT